MSFETGTPNSASLSLAIPTFNQDVQLAQAAKEFLEISQKYGHLIQILVQDNASTDSTQVELSLNWSFAELSRNDSNLGFAGNVETLALRSKGDWIWLLGSGDSPNMDQLEGLLNFLDDLEDDVGLIVAGKYKLFSPWIGGQIFRTSALRRVFAHRAFDSRWQVWPHLEWCLKIRAEGWRVIPLELGARVSRGEGDWHRTGLTYPLALELLRQLKSHPRTRETQHDIGLAMQACVAWYVQDRLEGKMGRFSLNLVALVRGLGFQILRPSLAGKVCAATLLPLGLIRVAVRVARGLGLSI